MQPTYEEQSTTWKVIDATEHHGTYVENEFGQTICDLYVLDRISDKPIEQENSKENAKRIVACVNACAGFTNAELENVLTIKESQALGQSHAEKYIEELKQQNAELLEKMQKMEMQFGHLKASFRVNMIRAYPGIGHEEITKQMNESVGEATS